MGTEMPTYPERQAADVVQGTVEIALNMVPLVGGALAELVEQVISPSVERRRHLWLEALASLVADLSTNAVTPETLAADEQWITAVGQATRVALGTHIDAKIRTLKRLLTNYALQVDRDELAIGRFIRFVEEFEPVHLTVLAYASNPTGWRRRAGLPLIVEAPLGVSDVLVRSGIEIDTASATIVLRDLEQAWLAKPHRTSEGDWSPEKLASTQFTLNLGEEFLRWIDAFE